MRYDKDAQLLRISFSEFVAIARRGISPTASPDEDEPAISPIARTRLHGIIGEIADETLHYRFIDGEYSFELSAVVERIQKNEITIARTVQGNPKKPKKNELAQIRGEGYTAAFMLARERGYDPLNIRFIYYGEGRGEVYEKTETVSKKKLDAFFERCLAAVRIFAAPEIDRVTRRLPSLAKMKFPYDNVREGQSEFVRSAYRTLSRGGCLYATAPTGTGKTVSALYPALRALGDGRVEKVFYLTPKTTTREAACDCLKLMAESGADLRAVVITAKDKICPMGNLCRKSSKLCRRSSHNMMAEATLSLFCLNQTVIDMDDLRETAYIFDVCPYELSLTYAELCDVVICDFNYLFDPVVYIKRFFTKGGKYAFLVDEAHNLHERAREMYSAELLVSEVFAPAEDCILGALSPTKKLSYNASIVMGEVLLPYLKDEMFTDREGRLVGGVAISEMPARLYSLFDELLSVVDDEISVNRRATDTEADQRLSYLRAYYYKLKRFADAMARFDSAYKLFIFYEDGDIRAKIFCLDTAPAIREGLNKGQGAVLFSATLSPLPYYRAVLGGDRSDDVLEVSSPFDPSQLSVCIMDKISTRYSERDKTLPSVCRAVAATVSSKRGNYMVFCPSFEYCYKLSKIFSDKYPKIKVICQTPNMSQKEKDEFLDSFRQSGGSYLIAFCVMGGIYSEGIDLAGDELIGAVIVGIGMPALSFEREAIAAYYEEKYEEGKQYAYIYPGMNRVFQAAGRVIRREDDRGVIVLIDDRFDDPIYKKSLPKLWEGVSFIGDAKELREELDSFWAGN